MSVGRSRDTPGLIMPPPFFLGIAVVVALVLDWVTGLGFLAAPGLSSVQSWIGLVVAAAAVALAAMGATEFRRSGTNVNPFQPALKLVTSGPYRFTRTRCTSA